MPRGECIDKCRCGRVQSRNAWQGKRDTAWMPSVKAKKGQVSINEDGEHNEAPHCMQKVCAAPLSLHVSIQQAVQHSNNTD